jgi:hypothetical protein
MGVRLSGYLIDSTKVVGERSVSIYENFVTVTWREGCFTGNPEISVFSIIRDRQEN